MVVPGDESHEELLAELVGSPYWKAILREIDTLRESAEAQLIAPPAQLVDVVLKERAAGKLEGYRTLIRVMEAKANKVRQAQSNRRT